MLYCFVYLSFLLGSRASVHRTVNEDPLRIPLNLPVCWDRLEVVNLKCSKLKCCFCRKRGHWISIKVNLDVIEINPTEDYVHSWQLLHFPTKTCDKIKWLASLSPLKIHIMNSCNWFLVSVYTWTLIPNRTFSIAYEQGEKLTHQKMKNYEVWRQNFDLG